MTFVVTPLVRRLGLRLGWIDQPSDRKVHPRPTPTVGGLAIFAGVVAALGVTRPPGPHLGARDDVRVDAALVAGAVIVLVGLVDDTRGLSPSASSPVRCWPQACSSSPACNPLLLLPGPGVLSPAPTSRSAHRRVGRRDDKRREPDRRARRPGCGHGRDRRSRSSCTWRSGRRRATTRPAPRSCVRHRRGRGDRLPAVELLPREDLHGGYGVRAPRTHARRRHDLGRRQESPGPSGAISPRPRSRSCCRCWCSRSRSSTWCSRSSGGCAGPRRAPCGQGAHPPSSDGHRALAAAGGPADVPVERADLRLRARGGVHRRPASPRSRSLRWRCSSRSSSRSWCGTGSCTAAMRRRPWRGEHGAVAPVRIPDALPEARGGVRVASWSCGRARDGGRARDATRRRRPIAGRRPGFVLANLPSRSHHPLPLADSYNTSGRPAARGVSRSVGRRGDDACRRRA